MPPYRALIVDDERIARVGLRAMLGAHAGLTVVGEAGNGVEAAAAVQALRPDVVFLDVRMPDRDGLDMLAQLPPSHHPAVVFVTAHREYALDAFRYSAVDYLLKPFTRDRLAITVGRVIRFLRGAAMEAYVSGSSDGAYHEARRKRLVVRDGDRLLFVEPTDVRWFEVFGNYVRVAVAGRYYLVRSTLGTLGAHLDRESFVRISRSVIVNLHHVQSVRRHANGQVELSLKGGVSLRSSRRYRRDVRHAFGV
jgi:two-component system LytT family response regulator